MALTRKKQDDKCLNMLRELVVTGKGNRECFDCGQKGPTYVNMTIGSFVCTRCSGVLRGLTPPHRVKSISMARFSEDDVEYLKTRGNDFCARTWLGLWDPKRTVHQDLHGLLVDKYERKRYYLEPASPLKSLTNAASLQGTSNAIGKYCCSKSSNGNGDLIAEFASAAILGATHIDKLMRIQSTEVRENVNNSKVSCGEDLYNNQDEDISNSNHCVSEIALSNNMENFADFDHAPIYNASGLSVFKDEREACEKSLLEICAHNNNNIQNDMTPSRDRYAALKDLDEQLRESKTQTMKKDKMIIPVQETRTGTTIINPFRFQHPKDWTGLMTKVKNECANDGERSIAQHQQSQRGDICSHNNAISISTTNTVFSRVCVGPNGCGFGPSPIQYELTAITGGGHNGTFNNPFAAAGAVNSNNPFL